MRNLLISSDPGAGLIPGKTVLHVSQDTKTRNVKNLLPKTQRVKKRNWEGERQETQKTEIRKTRLPQIIGELWVEWTAATPSWNSQTQTNICFLNNLITIILRKRKNKISPRAPLWSGSMCERLLLAEYKVGASVVYCFVHQSIINPSDDGDVMSSWSQRRVVSLKI